jgi:hypothetical protein
MILEGVIVTAGPDGRPHVAPMGPDVPDDFAAAPGRFVLRPYRTAQTCANLTARPEGVLHVTDDVLLLSRAAVGALAPPPPLRPATRVAGWVLAGACRAYEFRVVGRDDRAERVRLDAQVVHAERLRDFFGFNRAKHAVVEAAILATRVALLPPDHIAAEYARLAVLVQKTGGPREWEAFAFLQEHVRQKHSVKGP